MSTDWRQQGLCAQPGVNPEWWFPDKGDNSTWRIAHWYCKRCPVINQCALDAFANGGLENGIRAGMTGRALRKARATWPGMGRTPRRSA